jgi:hypothetical protein
MAIPAKRFEILTGETNVGINEFLEKKDSVILNLDSMVVLPITEELQGFADVAIQDPTYIDNLLAEAAQFAKTFDAQPSTEIRTTKDLLGAVKDLSKLSPKNLEKTLVSMLPNTGALNSTLFGNMSLLCKQNNFGFDGFGKPFDLSVSCGNQTRGTGSNCNNGQFTNIINKLTNGAYDGVFNDLNAVLKNLMSLSLFGYGLNLCGVFGALAGNVTDTKVLNRAAAGIASNLSEKGNSLGMFDLAASTAALGLKPILEAPNIVNKFLTNFKLPFDTKQKNESDIADRILATAEINKSSWDRSPADDILAIEEASMGYNSDLGNAFQSKTMDNSFTENDLNYIPSDDFTYTAVAYNTSSATDESFYM